MDIQFLLLRCLQLTSDQIQLKFSFEVEGRDHSNLAILAAPAPRLNFCVNYTAEGLERNEPCSLPYSVERNLRAFMTSDVDECRCAITLAALHAYIMIMYLTK